MQFGAVVSCAGNTAALFIVSAAFDVIVVKNLNYLWCGYQVSDSSGASHPDAVLSLLLCDTIRKVHGKDWASDVCVQKNWSTVRRGNEEAAPGNWGTLIS